MTIIWYIWNIWCFWNIWLKKEAHRDHYNGVKATTWGVTTQRNSGNRTEHQVIYVRD